MRHGSSSAPQGWGVQGVRGTAFGSRAGESAHSCIAILNYPAAATCEMSWRTLGAEVGVKLVVRHLPKYLCVALGCTRGGPSMGGQ